MATPIVGPVAPANTPKGRFSIGDRWGHWPWLPSSGAVDRAYHSWLHLRNGAAGEVLLERLPHLEILALQAFCL